MKNTSKYRILKNWLSLLTCLLFCQTLMAQHEVTLHIETEYSANKATTYITADNIVDFLGFQYSINWNPDVLTFVSAGSETLPIYLDGNHNLNYPGALSCAWQSLTSQPITLDDGSLFMKIEFDNLTGSTDGQVSITNTPIPIEFVKLINGNVETVPAIINGEVITEGTYLTGRVANDANADCIVEDDEKGLNQWRISVGNRTVFSNSEGYYGTFMELGTSTIKVVPPNDLWESCTAEFDVTATTVGEIVEQDIAAQAIYECPQMEVNIGAALIRRCFDGAYYVNYCNKGTQMATGAYIEVTLDEAIEYTGASIPLTSQTDNVLRFDIGDVDLGDCGAFRIDMLVGCDDVVLGQTHCTEARIFPTTDCTPPHPKWSGASIQVTSQCDDDEVVFYIQNIGAEDMDEVGTYIVIEDDIIMRNMIQYQLDAGDFIEVKMEANGKTYRLETDQVNYHPGSSAPSMAIEGCGTDAFGEFSTGFVVQFDQDDADAFVSIDCQENIGAYDPNDKQGFPVGVGDNHYMEENTGIEYMIRFQNTGTDTAFNIVVRDTLSEFLNFNSVRLGASSHPVVLTQEDNILIFNFDDILLVDSFANEPASNGFVRFHIMQTADNPIGTQIENKAAIYFDFNEPVITNTTMHMIGEEFVEVVVTSASYLKHPNLNVNVYPNPFVEVATFELEGIEETDLKLDVYDHLGRLVRSEAFQSNNLEFHKKNLISGTYYYEINSSQNHIATGQIIIH